ncbi:MAG TPA: carboxypeptidase-like regulatory domain-containing protein [Candidatus Baltobacteraceae bacterium]|jgi:hypothetical protein|nr:carboxypeptidase-like regulatory domain-containing protein [Candidatus Baltobacteraceae bacterium]
MRQLISVLALVAACTLCAAAGEPSGVAGTVLNLDNGTPFVNAAVAIYRLPLRENDTAVASAVSDRHGFFANITLDPGRYLITANVNGMHSSCEFQELYRGVITRVKLELSSTGERCVGKHIRAAVVVPGQSQDVYIMH